MKPYPVTIFMAGDISVAKQVCREECYREGLCVHIYAVDYIYTAGEEAGFAVCLIQYPRFPAEEADIWRRARDLAGNLCKKCCQRSFTLQATDRVEWFPVEGK